MLVLVLGDGHIPDRSISIPQKFKQLLIPGRIQHILVTGNVSRDTLQFLNTVSTNITQTAGDCDTTELPQIESIEFGSFKIGIVHGHQVIPVGNAQSLASIARKLDVDILVSGYTHVFEAYEDNQRFFVNPGSITGAFSAIAGEVNPSFVLMDVQASAVSLYVYQIVDGDVKVEKVEFAKKLF